MDTERELTVHTSEAHVRAVARSYGLTPERHDQEIVLRRWLEGLGEFLIYRATVRELVCA